MSDFVAEAFAGQVVEVAPKRGRGRPAVYSEQQWQHIRDLREATGNLTEVHRILSRKATTAENQALLDTNLFPEGCKIPSYVYLNIRLK
jgi:hypothetical protein